MKRLIQKLLAHRHPWRYIGFDELSELYTSTMLRSLGLSVIGIFVPIYLYNLGYSIPTICFFGATVYAGRCIFDIVAGYVVARIGPKHTILFSNMLQIIMLVLLLTLADLHTPLWLIALIWGSALSFFFLAYHVDFSKIMHQEHGGKELSYMTILERVGAASGPVVGGLIATFAGAEYTIIVAIVLFMASTLPLFMSQEPIRLHQHLEFRGLPYKKLWRDAISFAGMGFDNIVSVGIWPLYVALTILTVNTYANIGFVTSLGTVAAILSATFIGKVVDKNKGSVLYKWSTWTNAIVHLIRPVIGSFGGVLLLNVANEAVSTGYRMPYTKAMYARADDLPGYRIAYLVFIEVVGDMGKSLAWLLAGILCSFLVFSSAIHVLFICTACISLIMLVQRYPSLRPARFVGA